LTPDLAPLGSLPFDFFSDFGESAIMIVMSRCLLLSISASLLLATATAATEPAQENRSTGAIVDTSDSPYARLRGIDLRSVRWTDGFWHDRVQLVREETIPHLYDVMQREDVGKSMHNLEIAAGLKQGEYRGNDWQDAWLYKWIEMAVVANAIDGDERLGRQIDDLVELIAKAQEPDGYIATQNSVRNRPRFQDPHHHEWYTMGHLLTAAVLHHRLTGKDDFLNVAKKVGDFGYRMFRSQNKAMAHFPINPSIIMGAVSLYRETGDPKHLELAKMVIDIRGKYPGGTDCWQDRVPLRQEEEVVGHAVWYTYLYAGATDTYMETGDKSLLTALDRLWHNLTENKMYLHGGVCPLYRGFTFRNGNVWGSDEVWEAAGMNHQLPNAYGYNETCGQVGNFMWNYRMLLVTGEARFADVMEREMFNGFLGSMGQDGKGFFYVNPLRWHAHEQIRMHNSSLQRGIPGTPNIGTCCPTNFSRSLVELQGMLYSTTDEALWIHHYGANQFDNGAIRLEQETQFPWNGSVSIRLKQIDSNQVIYVRIPHWSRKASVLVNGQPVDGVATGTYLRLAHPWKVGDTITLDFKMQPRLVVGNPKIEETRGQVAVMRGPVLYALEEADLPKGVAIEDVLIPSNIQLDAAYKPELLGGVTVLEGTAYSLASGAWEGNLYRDVQARATTEFRIRLIPYYSWANRGISKMTVWMPVDWK
jgi:DUF1680 family protein